MFNTNEKKFIIEFFELTVTTIRCNSEQAFLRARKEENNSMTKRFIMSRITERSTVVSISTAVDTANAFSKTY